MLIQCCYPLEWGAAAGETCDDEISRRIRVALCCQYYLSYAIRQGMPPSRLRDDESQIRDEVHGNCLSLSVVEAKRSQRSRCDICGVVEIVRRMAMSQYAQESREFVVKTRHDENARARYDWANAIRDYASSAKLNPGSRLGMVASRAIVVMEFVQKCSIRSYEFVPPEPELYAAPESSAMPVGEIVHLMRCQVQSLQTKQLRIIS